MKATSQNTLTFSINVESGVTKRTIFVIIILREVQCNMVDYNHETCYSLIKVYKFPEPKIKRNFTNQTKTQSSVTFVRDFIIILRDLDLGYLGSLSQYFSISK